MNRDFIDKIKLDFSFLDISDDDLEKVFNRCIDPKKSEEENKEKIYKVLYGIVSDNYLETGSFFDIEKYIESNFDISTLEKSIESLNNFSQFLTKCKIDINRDNYNKILKESEPFVKCLKNISISNELSKDQKTELLSEKSLDILDFYYEDNSYYTIDYSEDFDISDEEELEKKLENIDSLVDPSITTNAVKLYLKEISRYKMLTKEEEYELTKLYKETKDKKVRDKIINANLRLVVSVAVEISKNHKSLPLLDLISAGNMGLFRTLDDYDPEKASFSTYARPWIKQKIMREIQDNGHNIRVPIHTQDNMRNYFKRKKLLEEKLGREPTINEINKELGISIKKIGEFEFNLGNTISMNTKILDDEDGTELGAFIADNDDVIPEEVVLKNDNSMVDMLLNGLTELEKTIIQLRTGLYDGTEYTLEEVAGILLKLGLKDKTLTRERIRQIELKAKRKIKKNKEKYEKDLQLLNEKKRKDEIVEKLPTINDVINLIQGTDEKIMLTILSILSRGHKAVLNECFGEDILAATLQEPSDNMLRLLLKVVYPKILYEINKLKKHEALRTIVLPNSIYLIEPNSSMNNVEKKIDELESFERLVLYKFYDMYTGEKKAQTNATSHEKELIVKILTKLKNGLLQTISDKEKIKEKKKD